VDYFAIRTAILLWLVRPQDWISGLGGFQFMQFAMLLAIIGVYTRGRFELKMLWSSPADILVLAYLGWITYTSGDLVGTAKALLPYFAFYYCTALALNTRQKLSGFISCWVAGIGVVAAMAAASGWGFELVSGSSDLTSSFAGRLSLNTWIFNNPNSLGHGVVVLIPLAFIWCVWKRPPGLQILGLAFIGMAASTVYMTQSKGAYLCGAFAVTVAWLFRKPKFLQGVILALMLTAGLAAVKMLPRMEEMNKQEEGIAGRLMIWQMAHNAMRNTFTGEGWKQFEAWLDTEEYGLFKKATHGSYVNVGADLGYPGLFLFIGIMYAGARTLYQAKPDSDQDLESERCQRALLVLLSSFASSAFIIDRAYHTDYFILAGAIAAFHRIMTQDESSEEEATASDGGHPSLAYAGHVPMEVFNTAPGLLTPSNTGASFHAGDEAEESAPRDLLPWRRLGLQDVVFMLMAFFAVLFLWEKVMTDFISF
jgi:hypothetical protein